MYRTYLNHKLFDSYAGAKATKRLLAIDNDKLLSLSLSTFSKHIKREHFVSSVTFSESMPMLCAQHINHRNLHITPVRSRCLESQSREVDLSKTVFYFDTHALVKKLQSSGFTLEQCESISEALVHVYNIQIEQQNKIMVTKSQQEITVQQLLANIASVKKDMLILEKSEFENLRHETEKQTIEINRTHQMVTDEISKLKGQVTLDINLERSRAKEAHAEGETKRSILNNRIDMEVANLRTIYEQYRNDVLKYAGGTVLSCLTICLGFYRLWS